MNSSTTSVAGFTIIELMIVVAIAGILAMIAVPGFTSLTQSQRIKNASFELYSSLSMARSEALKRNNNVTVTFQTVSAAFPAPTHNEVNWAITEGGVTILSQAQIKGIAYAINPAATTVIYQRNGRISSAAAPVFTLDAPGTATQYRRCIKIELSGMPRIYKPVNGACT